MEFIRPHTVRYIKDPSPALVEYRKKHYKNPEPRPYRCSDTQIDLDRPEKAFVQVWNMILRRKQRYLPALRATSSSDNIYAHYHAFVLAGLLEKGEKQQDFNVRLFRKTVERIDVHPSGKMTFTFKAGIKISI